MEMRVLQYFLTVAQEESVTRAAEVLHITQPTLSRQLAQLERELGVSLFRRGARKIVLTDEGLLLRRRAEEILDLADRTTRELAEQRDEVEGVVPSPPGRSARWSFSGGCAGPFGSSIPVSGSSCTPPRRMWFGSIWSGVWPI